MTPLRIVADDKIPFLRGVFETQGCEVVYISGAKISNADLKNADVLLTRTRTHCNAALLDGTRVKLIASATIGYDHIDTAYCDSHGIRWINAPGCNAESVGQYVIASLLLLAQKHEFNLAEKTLGIIGVGHTGSAVRKYADALGMNTLLKDPPRAERDPEFHSATLEETLANSDIITIHTPLTPRTCNWVDRNFLARMKRGALLINSARGEIIVESDLRRALNEKHLADVVIDVWRNEPVIDTELMNQTFISTPHIAGYAADGKWNGTRMIVQAVSKMFVLGLDQWSPAALPVPEHPIINLSQSPSLQDALTTAVTTAYDPRLDATALRHAPGDFEKLRGDYPFRRTFDAYQVIPPQNISSEIFRRFGFGVTDR